MNKVSIVSEHVFQDYNEFDAVLFYGVDQNES